MGQGFRHFDIETFGTEAAYTLDDSEAGAICGETFSADRAIVRITGRSAHPGTAKGRMVSALKIAADVVAALPLEESPEGTEGREAALRRIVDGAVARRPGASAEIEIVKQYRNMADGLARRPEVMARAQA